MANATESRILITPTFRLYYPTLLTPRAYQENGVPKGKPRYSIGMIFEPAQIKEFKEFDEATETFVDVNFSVVLKDVARKAWPEIEDIDSAIKHGGIGWPIKRGDAVVAKKDGKHEEHLAGKYLINSGSIEDYPPVLKVRKEGKMKNLMRGLTDNDAKIKSLFIGGNYAYAELNIKPTNVSDKKYLTLYLNAVVFVKPGEAIGGGGGSYADRYAQTQGGEADVDPSEGMAAGDDEIPY